VHARARAHTRALARLLFLARLLSVARFLSLSLPALSLSPRALFQIDDEGPEGLYQFDLSVSVPGTPASGAFV